MSGSRLLACFFPFAMLTIVKKKGKGFCVRRPRGGGTDKPVKAGVGGEHGYCFDTGHGSSPLGTQKHMCPSCVVSGIERISRNLSFLNKSKLYGATGGFFCKCCMIETAWPILPKDLTKKSECKKQHANPTPCQCTQCSDPKKGKSYCQNPLNRDPAAGTRYCFINSGPPKWKKTCPCAPCEFEKESRKSELRKYEELKASNEPAPSESWATVVSGAEPMLTNTPNAEQMLTNTPNAGAETMATAAAPDSACAAVRAYAASALCEQTLLSYTAGSEAAHVAAPSTNEVSLFGLDDAPAADLNTVSSLRDEIQVWHDSDGQNSCQELDGHEQDQMVSTPPSDGHSQWMDFLSESAIRACQ